MRQVKDQGWTTPVWHFLLVAVLAISTMSPAQAGFREQAKRMHDRLAGVPPSDTVLQTMENMLAAGNDRGAALEAMKDRNFYNVTLKNFSAPWTNRDQSVFVPFNDYIATVIGMIRDGVPFNTLLSADLTYIGNSGVVPAGPSRANNDHYAQLEANNVDLFAELTDVPQSSIQQIPSAATAGVMTSRAAAEAFFIAGTNRAMFRFTLLNHLCNDMEQVHDPKLPPDRIRQDVSRSPGGDSRLFLNNCVGCHTGMDPMAQAFAYYNYVPASETTGQLEYSASGPGPGGTVQDKYFNNDLNFPQGYRTPDDHWDNYWRGEWLVDEQRFRTGQNSYLGFSDQLPGSGNGAKSLGEEFGNSRAFAACQVKKVFRTVCLRDPDLPDQGMVDTLTTDFMTSLNYSMKEVFAQSAAYCKGP